MMNFSSILFSLFDIYLDLGKKSSFLLLVDINRRIFNEQIFGIQTANEAVILPVACKQRTALFFQEYNNLKNVNQMEPYCRTSFASECDSSIKKQKLVAGISNVLLVFLLNFKQINGVDIDGELCFLKYLVQRIAILVINFFFNSFLFDVSDIPICRIKNRIPCTYFPYSSKHILWI